MTGASNLENRSIVKSLIKVAKSEGSVNMSELTYIVWAGKKLGLSKRELAQLACSEVDHVKPFGLKERLGLLYELVKLLMSDGKPLDDELEECRTLAEKMELDKTSTDRLFHHINKLSDGVPSREEFELFFAQS